MVIDLGDIPVGTPPTEDQKLQIRNAIGITAATVPITPAGGIAATTVQAAINELDAEKAPAAAYARTDIGQTFSGAQSFTGQMSSSGSNSTGSSTNLLNMATNDVRYLLLSGGQIVANSVAANVAITVRGAVSQTAALQKWQNSGGSDLMHFGINGRLGIGTSAPSYPIHVEVNANDTTSGIIQVKNLSTGNTATAEFRAENDLGRSGRLFKTGSSYTGYKTLGANSLGFYNDASAGNISILNDFTGGNITFTAGGSSTAHVTIASNGDATFTEKAIVTGGKLILGGVADGPTGRALLQSSTQVAAQTAIGIVTLTPAAYAALVLAGTTSPTTIYITTES